MAAKIIQNESVFRIHLILMWIWIRIHGSSSGKSGSGSDLKSEFFLNFLLLIFCFVNIIFKTSLFCHLWDYFNNLWIRIRPNEVDPGGSRSGILKTEINIQIEKMEFSQYWISGTPPFIFVPLFPSLAAAALGPLAFSSRSARPPSLF